MANRAGLAFRPPLTSHSSHAKTMSLINEPPHVTVWDAISDLPSLEHGEGSALTPYASDGETAYQKLVRNAGGVVANHVSRRLQPTQHARLASLKPGQGHKDLPSHLQVKAGYSGAYGRLTKDMIAPTITRWVFHPGSGRYGHPVDVRTLSIREIARIQGFPDDFEFVGTFTDQAGQLGNAVPPLLAAAVLRDLDAQLERHSSSRISVRRSNDNFSASDGREKLRV